MANSIKVVFTPSDNNLTSGAFLSMVRLLVVLKDKYSVDPLVIVPSDGDGIELLEKYNIAYKTVRSFPWVIKDSAKINFETLKIILWRIRENQKAIKELKSIYRKFRPDLVHINTSWTYVGALSAYRCKIPVVWHIREYLEEDQHIHILIPFIGYKIMGHANAIIPISNDLKVKYSNIFPSKKLHLIYNGVDVNAFYNPNKRIFNQPVFRFLCVGGLYVGKNQRLLIQALAKIREKGIDNFALKIVGIGGEMDNLVKLVNRLQLNDFVFFEGFQKNTRQYYDEADIVFMVSDREAFGRVTVEAMLNGALIIGSDSGGTPEILQQGKCGILYTPGDIEDLANKIVFATNNIEYSRAMAKMGQKIALKCFSDEINAERVYELYKEVLNRDERNKSS